MFHSKTDDEIKDKNREDMTGESKIRILVLIYKCSRNGCKLPPST